MVPQQPRQGDGALVLGGGDQEAEIETNQADHFREMKMIEEEKHMRMLQVRNMQIENRFVEVVEEGEKQEGEV